MYQPDIRPLHYVATSYHWFEKVRHLAAPIFLDSNHPNSPYGQFDIISAAPQTIISYQHNTTYITTNKKTTISHESPFTILQDHISNQNKATKQFDNIPFCGGAMGYFGYDLMTKTDNALKHTTEDINIPDMHVGIYPWVIITDHKTKTTRFIANNQCNQHEKERIYQLLTTDHNLQNKHKDFILTTSFTSNLTPQDYEQRYNKIMDYLHAGDCYQVNLAQRFSANYQGDPWQAYLLLREVYPTPYSAFLQTTHGSILSHSPEQFIQIKNKQVTSRPIKGTRPRGKTLHEDQQLAIALQTSSKDHAENIMIVDLLRNDLNRNCKKHSVKVTDFLKLEQYDHIQHLVSTITGDIADNKGSLDLIEGCFPGGSITGAPKKRAMEIIEELEPNRRSVYCGAIGYIGFDGDADLNIAIRTLVCHQNEIHCWGGGGIVADSTCNEEYAESMTKIMALLNALEKINTPQNPNKKGK